MLKTPKNHLRSPNNLRWQSEVYVHVRSRWWVYWLLKDELWIFKKVEAFFYINCLKNILEFVVKSILLQHDCCSSLSNNSHSWPVLSIYVTDALTLIFIKNPLKSIKVLNFIYSITAKSLPQIYLTKETKQNMNKFPYHPLENPFENIFLFPPSFPGLFSTIELVINLYLILSTKVYICRYKAHFYIRELCVQENFVYKGPLCTRDLCVQVIFVYNGSLCTRDLCVQGAFVYKEPLCTRDLFVQGTLVYKAPLCTVQCPCTVFNILRF